MKRALIVLCPLALLVGAIGCDDATLAGLPGDVQALVSSVSGFKTDLTALASDLGPDAQSCPQVLNGGDQVQNQIQNRHDYGGDNGAGPGGTGSGTGGGANGQGDQLRLRDGSCNDDGEG